jgi:type II secretion system protein C
MARANTTKKAASRITQKAEERIVELSLQNPDFGAKRLVPLLKQKKIKVSSSQIYGILKHNGLQNRNARLARLKTRKTKKLIPAKTPLAKIAPEVEEQVVEIALQHPDLGAKRLLPLLQDSGIDVSTSRVYNILKRRGLQTRKLRLARLDELSGTEDAPAPEKAPAELTPEIEERIVEVSLQNPESGTRHLAGLLAGEGISISSSAIYSLLKRHGLQTSALRKSRIDLLHLTETGSPAVETAVQDAVPMPAMPEELEQAPEDTLEISETPPLAPAPSVLVKSPPRARWLFYLADLLLLALVGYLGYLGYHTVLNFKQSGLQPEAVAAVKPEPARRAVQPQIAAEPLTGYHKIWERNLFNIPDKTAPAPKAEIPIEKIALAQKNIGLKLVGTVVADDATYSRAIVHVSKTREQDAYREGDQAGKAKIKKILRNKVIITTDKGDQLLTIDDEDFGKGGKVASKQRGASSQLSRRRARSINLKHEEVLADLADADKLLQELIISPFVQDDQPAGFIISKIPRGSILTKMGLRNGYVVTQLNDQEITSPDQAAEFFSTLAEGGEVTIQVRRSRGVRRSSRQINLNIE